MTAGAETPAQRARAIEGHLRQDYGYTLELLSKPVDDPLAYFLFVRKKGHCEYFASSMAVMLRTLGIPARVVNGFRGGEYNDLTGSYIVREKDAHSWVEAYFPEYGWVTFDPTPAGQAGSTATRWSRALSRSHTTTRPSPPPASLPKTSPCSNAACAASTAT